MSHLYLAGGTEVDRPQVYVSTEQTTPATGDGGGGMDAWQTSVETRLTALDNRLTRIDERLSKVETSLATLTERVAHLPTKTALYSTAVGIVIALTAAITFGQKLQALVAPPSTTTHQVGVTKNNS